MIEFTPWPKIARLNRDMIITEKIDGSNAAIGIVGFNYIEDVDGPVTRIVLDNDAEGFGMPGWAVYAQSRKRIITPDDDNFGFAAWVRDNAEALVETLGIGLHFGEWWGSGINRGYGLQKGEKRFSLFNTPRYGDPEKFDLAPLKDIGVDTVPVLYEGPFNQDHIEHCLVDLSLDGSVAAPGFMDPEGIIVFHVAAQTPFKVTIKGDDKPKGSNE